MYFDDYVDEVVEDEEEEFGSDEDSTGSGEDLEQLSAVSSRERLFLRVPTAAKNAPVPRTAESGAENTAFSALETVVEGHEADGLGGDVAAPEGSQVKLEAGIVDYCVILGPADPFSLLRPTHFTTPTGALSALSLSTRAAAAGEDQSGVAAPNTPQSSAPYTGLFGGNGDAGAEEQEIVVWDRLPRHDHVGIEMPSKVRFPPARVLPYLPKSACSGILVVLIISLSPFLLLISWSGLPVQKGRKQSRAAGGIVTKPTPHMLLFLSDPISTVIAPDRIPTTGPLC